MKALLDQVQKQNERPFGTLSLAFSSMAQSAARQQRPNTARLLSALAQSFQIQALNASRQAAPDQDGAQKLADVQAQIKAQLGSYAPAIEQTTELGERGALRALVWGQKVTMIQNSLLTRLGKQGAALFKGKQGVHVCEACGFVVLKEGAPDVCPICKAPRSRFASL
jgi:rubrerythrin